MFNPKENLEKVDTYFIFDDKLSDDKKKYFKIRNEIFSHTDKKNNLIGFIETDLFPDKSIDIILNDDFMEKEHALLVMTILKEDEPIIYIDSLFYCDLKEYPEELVAIYRQIGHLVYGHFNFLDVYFNKYKDTRIERIENKNLSQIEIEADRFACDYLGLEMVIDHLLTGQTRLNCVLKNKESTEEELEEIEQYNQEYSLRMDYVYDYYGITEDDYKKWWEEKYGEM